MDKAFNKLSFKNIREKYGRFVHIYYEFYVDGKKLDYSSYDWGYADDVDLIDSFEGCVKDQIEDDFLNIVLFHCSCGTWMCDSLVARVIYAENQVTWQLHYLYSEEIEVRFIFEKAEYEFLIKELEKKVYDDHELIYSNQSIKKKTGKLSRKEKKKLKKAALV